MRRVNFPFDFYNPQTDEQLDPSDVEKIISNSPIPTELHHTVHQAKALIGDMTIEDIIRIDDECETLCVQAITLNFGVSRPITARDVYYNDDAERLRLALSKGKHSVPPSEWSRYMGVFALKFAGLIHCQVWPTPDYIKMKYDGKNPGQHINSASLLKNATTAARAATYGEAFRDILLAEIEFREISRRNGRNAHKEKHKIIAQFIEWSLAAPKHLNFRTTKPAAIHFIEHVLTKEQRKYANAKSFHETLAKGLKEYCSREGISHPLKKKLL